MRKLLVMVSFMVAACGGGAPSEVADETNAPAEAAPTEAPAATAAPTTAGGDSGSDATTPPANGSGAGHITLTVGDETWEFDGALCAYSGAPAGEAGSEWNVSFLQNDLQVYINQDATGPSVELTNVVDYGTLRWAALGDAVQITVSGNNISASGTFADESDASSGSTSDGTLEATCASWLNAS